MARNFPQNIRQREFGKLRIEQPNPGITLGYFIPLQDGDNASILDFISPDVGIKLFEIEEESDLVLIYPLNTNPASYDYLQPKYKYLDSIALHGLGNRDLELGDEDGDIFEFLESLPNGFVKDYNYGLGFLKEYSFLVEILEEYPIKHLIISEQNSTQINLEDSTCTLNLAHFNTILKSVDRITRQVRVISRKVKTAVAYNNLAYFLQDKRFPQRPFELGDSTLERLIAKTSSIIHVNLSRSEQREAVELISSNKKSIVEDQPEILYKLHNEIELVALEKLIERFEEMLEKKCLEASWQKLFSDNPFILSLVFGYPVIKVQNQAHVGGRKISGSGESIADFLVKNNLSNNTALFEIKKPSEAVVFKTPYRENIFGPSAQLAGALNQLLDQKRKFLQEIALIKHNSGIHDIQSYAVHGILIIGCMPSGEEEKKSFELFRGNSKDVSIITFDELLEKLKQLHQFLCQGVEE